MFDNLHLTNMLRSEVEHIPETGLPLDAFPDKIQEIILNLSRYENFNIEYTASIIPVSYTHLDVYKRQDYARADRTVG